MINIIQKWYFSPVVIASIAAKVGLILALWLNDWQLNVFNVVVLAIVGIIQIISDANNPTNKIGIGANIGAMMNYNSGGYSIKVK